MEREPCQAGINGVNNMEQLCMPTYRNTIPAMREFIKSDIGLTLSLAVVALALFFAGLNVGYFVVLWIEWGAILGGLAIVASVFLFPARGERLRELRVMLYVAGIALVGAGISDLLNFPESGKDVIPGLLAGFLCGVVSAKFIWKAAHGPAGIRLSALFHSNGVIAALLLSLLGGALFALADFLKNYGLAANAGDALASVGAVALQLYHLKRNGSRMSRGAVWITFFAMLVFLLCALANVFPDSLNTGEASIGLGIVMLSGISLLGWKWVRGSRPASAPTNFKLMGQQLLTLVFLGVALFPLGYLYTQALVNLELNLSPTELVAGDRAFFKLSDEAFARLVMRDIYYWQPKHNVFMSKEDTPATLIRKLASDRWSHASTASEEKDWDAGIKTGRGIKLTNQLGKYFIGYINHDSPAAKAGYERGYQLITRDQRNISVKNKQWLILKPSGEVVTNSLPSERYKVDTVIHKVIQRDGKNIGYLWMMDFNNAALPLIQDAFKLFKQQSIEELVLDLRYNGGGYDDTLLADLIAGAKNEGKIYSKSSYSEKYRDKDGSTVFHSQPYSIPVKRVFVLMTHNTCSASELIINGLRPYLPVITIGEKSCGKPFFMQQISYRENVYDPVTGRIKNVNNQAEYEQGIEPDCKVQEDFSKPVGQPGDALLDTALYFQKHNECPTAM